MNESADFMKLFAALIAIATISCGFANADPVSSGVVASPMVITANELMKNKNSVPTPDVASNAFIDDTGMNGGPRWRGDQDHSFLMQCGYVAHRFFDEKGNSVDRPVRVCN